MSVGLPEVADKSSAEVANKSAYKSSKILLKPFLRRALGLLTLMGLDTVALLVGLVLAAYLVGGERRVGEVVYFAPILLAVWLAIFAAHNLYGRAQIRRNVGALLGAVLWYAALLGLGSAFYPQSGFSAREILLGIFLVIALDGGLRLLYERGIEFSLRWRLGLVPTLIVGAEEERAGIRQVMEKHPSAYTCVGELNLNGQGVDLPLLRQTLDRTKAQRMILIGSERLPETDFLDLLRSMWLRRVEVEVVPAANTLIGEQPVISRDVGLPLVRISYPHLNKTQWTLKRALDVVGSLLGLIVLSPLLVGVTVLIKLTSPGSVLFRQKRAGADGKVFTCYKFRSMYQDAEQRQAELEAVHGLENHIFKLKDDPRVTPVGRLLRGWSIDELPQLINVLKGEMSLVGPRPLPLRDAERIGEVGRLRLSAVPGMTGYWQVSGRSELASEEMIRLDIFYVENWSLSFDLQIILKTVGAVLRRRGAY